LPSWSNDLINDVEKYCNRANKWLKYNNFQISVTTFPNVCTHEK